MKPFFYAFFIALILTNPAQAQTNSDAPIEVTADNTLEWRRNEKQYVADGNAVVKQGDVTIRGSRIVADYRDGEKSGMEIYRLTADGDVSIENAASSAKGEKLVYDVEKGLATMTGKNLLMTAEGQTVTATERFEYNVKDSTLNAIGNARTTRGQDTMQAHAMSAVFQKDKTGKQALDRMEAHGNVVIATPTETLTGRDAVYTAATNRAVITGNVRITRGDDELTGERGEVDLTTNISRLFGGADPANPGKDGRVRGIFHPGKSPANTMSQ